MSPPQGALQIRSASIHDLEPKTKEESIEWFGEHQDIVKIAKIAFGLTLYFIGTAISVSAIRKVGARPLLQGLILWIFITMLSLSVIAQNQ